jgi:hypothetical protein
MEMHRPPLRTVILAGFLAGFLVLGLGGRVVMRILAYTTPAAPRFTIAGTLQVIALGAIWGGLTAPVWQLLSSLPSRWIRVVTYGSVALGLAGLALALLATFGGRVVAPLGFLVLGAVLFPLLFLAHAGLLEWLVTRWSPRVATG